MDDLGARRGRTQVADAHGATSQGPSGHSGRVGLIRLVSVDWSGRSVRFGAVRVGSVIFKSTQSQPMCSGAIALIRRGSD